MNPFFEGSLIRAYFHENKWMISTKNALTLLNQIGLVRGALWIYLMMQFQFKIQIF